MCFDSFDDTTTTTNTNDQPLWKRERIRTGVKEASLHDTQNTSFKERCDAGRSRERERERENDDDHNSNNNKHRETSSSSLSSGVVVPTRRRRRRRRRESVLCLFVEWASSSSTKNDK